MLTAEMALDDRRRDDAREAIDKALKVNPKSLDALSLRAAVDFVEGKQTDFETHAKEVLAINPRYGDVFRIAGDHAARNYLFDEAVALTRRAIELDDANPTAHANLGMHLLRTGDEPAARRSLERAFKDDPYNVVTFNSLALLDSLDKFQTIQDGDLIFRFHPDEVTVMREHAIPLAKEAFAALIKQLRLHAQGPDPDRDVPQARRLRGAHAGAARHGGRAGRVLRPRGHAGFAQGSQARRVPLGRDLVARAGARHDAADVEQPRAALADRRHVGVGRAARPSRVGPGKRLQLPAGARGRQDAEARDPERRVQRPSHHLAGVLPGVAGRRAHRGYPRRGRAAPAAARLRPGSRGRGRTQGLAGGRLGGVAGVVRQAHRARLRRSAPGPQGPRAEGEDAARRAEEARHRQPGQRDGADGARPGAGGGEGLRRGACGLRACRRPACRGPAAAATRTR